MKRTSEQNKRLFALLYRLGWTEDRGEFVLSFTNGRTTSTAQMNREECESLIQHLQSFVTKSESDREKDKKRKKVIAIAHNLGWKLPSGKVDISSIQNFINEKGVVKKPFNEYNLMELSKLIYQFEKIYEYTIKH